MAFQHEGHFFEITVGAIGAAADEHLLDRDFGHIGHFHHIVRHMGAGHQGFQGVQVDFHFFIIAAAFIRQPFGVVLFPSLGLQEIPYLCVRREYGSGSAHFRAHIGNGQPFRDGQGFHPFSHIFIDFAHAAFHRVPAEHLKDNILGSRSRLEMALQFHFHHFGHFQHIRESGQSHSDIHAAHADSQHAQGTAARRMAVAAQKQSPRFAEAAALQGMADPVSCLGKDQPVFLGNGLQIDMVIRCFVVDLQQIMIDVADGQFGPDPFQVQCLKSQIGHNGVDVMRQGLIHCHLDFFSRHQTGRFSQMSLKQFLRQILCHVAALLLHFFLNLSTVVIQFIIFMP